MEATVTPTRADYMAGRCTHRQFYGAVCRTAGIVFDSDRPIVQRSRDALANGDEHLNTIGLRTWDILGASASHAIDRALRLHGDWPSLAGRVCVVKEAARQAVERESNPTDCTKCHDPHNGENRYDGYGIYIGRLCDGCAAKDSRMEFGRSRQFDPDFAGERLEEDDA